MYVYLFYQNETIKTIEIMSARLENVKKLIANGAEWNGTVYSEYYNKKNAEVGVYIDGQYFFLYNTPIAWVEGKREDTLLELKSVVVESDVIDDNIESSELPTTVYVKGIYDCECGVQELEVTNVFGLFPNHRKNIVFKGSIKDISSTNCFDEIDEYIKQRFEIKGVKIIVSIE